MHEDDDSVLVYGEERLALYVSEGRYVRYPRENFNSFSSALTTIFIVILGEDWNFVVYTWIRSVSEDSFLKSMALTYFMTLIVSGNFIMMSLFTALLLRNFEDEISKDVEDAAK